MAKQDAITAQYLRSILDYNPQAGAFTWRRRENFPRKWNTRFAGKIAGCINIRGYVVVRIDGYTCSAHRLAWLYMTGNWPVSDIDHMDGNRSNNIWDNLREATRAQNGANRRLGLLNTSGAKGVCWVNGSRKWRACIKISGKKKHLGMFDNIADAAAAYEQAANEAFGEFARVA